MNYVLEIKDLKASHKVFILLLLFYLLNNQHWSSLFFLSHIFTELLMKKIFEKKMSMIQLLKSFRPAEKSICSWQNENNVSIWMKTHTCILVCVLLRSSAFKLPISAPHTLWTFVCCVFLLHYNYRLFRLTRLFCLNITDYYCIGVSVLISPFFVIRFVAPFHLKLFTIRIE